MNDYSSGMARRYLMQTIVFVISILYERVERNSSQTIVSFDKQKINILQRNNNATIGEYNDT